MPIAPRRWSSATSWSRRPALTQLAAWLVLAIGLAVPIIGLVMAGVGLFSAVVLYQLVNLPVEFDAGARARRGPAGDGLGSGPRRTLSVARVLNAAAWTYVAATLTSILTLLYFLSSAPACSAAARARSSQFPGPGRSPRMGWW